MKKEDVFLNSGYIFTLSEDEKRFTSEYSLRTGYFGWLLVAGCTGRGAIRMLDEKILDDVYEVEIEFNENDLV